MNQAEYNQGLFRFIKHSPTQFHAVSAMADELEKNGFTCLKEQDTWKLEKGGKYFAVRNGSSIIAFIMGMKAPADTGIRIAGAHTDSPCLKVKPHPELKDGSILRTGVEVYGGALLTTWFDRKLNLAGRVTCLEQQNDSSEIFKSFLINYNRPVAVIPSLAIHFERNSGTEKTVNPQLHIHPVFLLNSSHEADPDSRTDPLKQSKVLKNKGDAALDSRVLHINSNKIGEVNSNKIGEDNIADSVSFNKILIKQIEKEYPNSAVKTVLGFDLNFSDIEPPCFAGLNNEFISSPRLDNLISCYACLKSIINADGSVTSLILCTDHEEIGSSTWAGARGNFFESILTRISITPEDIARTAASSIIISLDNAHAFHPSYGEKYDTNHLCQLNFGPVLKINASEKYASNSETSALFKFLCKKAGLDFQTFIMKNDIPCGSTIGPAISSQTGIRAVDMGAPTLAMHSIRELTGNKDPFMVFKVMEQLFSMDGQMLLSLT